MDTHLQAQYEALELAFPAKSGEAFAKARAAALAAGLSVLQVEDGVLYQVSPDGTRTQVKPLESPTKVTLGDKYQLR